MESSSMIDMQPMDNQTDSLSMWHMYRAIYVLQPRYYEDIKVSDLTGEANDDTVMVEIKRIAAEGISERVHVPVVPEHIVVALLP